MSDLIDSLRLALDRMEHAQPRRYSFRFNRTAEVYLRRLAWPHKWRGRRRSMRHLRPALEWLRSVEDIMNRPEIYAQVDMMVGPWIERRISNL